MTLNSLQTEKGVLLEAVRSSRAISIEAARKGLVSAVLSYLWEAQALQLQDGTKQLWTDRAPGSVHLKDKTDYFKKTLKDQNDGVRKIVDWLKKKVGLNKHADIVRVLNKFFNATRNKNENLGSRRPSKK